MGSGITSGECSEQDTLNVSEKSVLGWLYTPTDTSIITIIIPMIWCLGIITNLIFLFVLCRVPKLRSETNTYLAHLAIADLLYLSLGSALNIWSYTASRVAFHVPFVNSAQCICFFTIVNTGYFASITLVTMVSFERYLALCHPVKHLKVRGRRRTYKMVAVCWLVGLIFSVATVPGSVVLRVLCLQWPDVEEFWDYPTSITFCGPVTPQVDFFVPPLLNVPWLIAMVANIYMYVRILEVLSKRSSKNSGINKHHKAVQIRNQVARMLIVNGVVFFLCQTPYRIFSLAGWICWLAQIPNPLAVALGNNQIWLSLIPQYVNGMINPLIYGAMNSIYRSSFREAFHCNGRVRQRDTSAFAISTADQSKSNATVETLAINDITETKL
ncbi:somatostatin receptor type 2-like [Acanthaster planci]|uniref:Somatostatin receptor type 2-like n=1 Tax=Acanthaster planci TaxID=133434 RepID=A0A8B7ZD96_ACAPL|nr:somatostatin receptor type 2-like [Acanthaster planci]XP_022101166.1 somatostatin receptor type 2-like [Acanthaster planci]